MDHLDLAGVLTTPPQWNLPAFEQQDAIYLSSSRQMLEPIMEETSEDEEYALNSWQQYDQQSSDAECGATTEGESVCGGNGGAGGASFWSSAESDTGSVIRIEVTKDNDSTSERDFLCPAKRPRRCEESLAQSLPEEEVILRRPLYGVEKNNSLERFLNYENFSRDSWGTNSQQRSSVGSRRGFDDFYSDSDSLSYNSLSRSSSLIQFESLERQLLMQEQHASMTSLGNSSPSLMSFEINEDTQNKPASNSANNSANNSRRGSQSSLLKKYESLDGRLHQTYYDLDKLNFDDMDNSSGDNFSRNANLKMAELRSDSESSSEGSEGSSRPQSVLSPADLNDNEFLFKKFNRTNSQQSKKGKSSAENLSEDSGYCEPSLGFGLRRSKSQSLLKNYEKFSEEEEEMENKSLIHGGHKQTFNELNAEQQQQQQQQQPANNKHSIINEFKNTTTRHETISSPPLSPHLEFIRHKQRTEAHSPSPVSSEVSTSSSTSSQSTTQSNNSSTSSSSSASSTSSATTCASKASFTWLMPSAATTARQSSRVHAAEEENQPSQISINDLRELKTSNEENVQIFSGKFKNHIKEFSSISPPGRDEYVQLVENEDECLECKNICEEYELNECRNCGEKVITKPLQNYQEYFLSCQKCKENFQNIKEIECGNSELNLNCENCGEKYLVDIKLNSSAGGTLNCEKVRKKQNEKSTDKWNYAAESEHRTDDNSETDKSGEFENTEINESFVLDYDSSFSTPESLKRVQTYENSAQTLIKYHKHFDSSCSSTPETSRRLPTTAVATLGCSASSDSDYSPLRVRKNFNNLMPSWPVKTSSVPNELNTIGRKKKHKKSKFSCSPQPAATSNKSPEPSTDNDSVNDSSLTSNEDLDLLALNLKRSLSWSFQPVLQLESSSLCVEAKNLGILHQSYHNLALLNLDSEQENSLSKKMADKRISSDYEAEIVCKNNFLLDELSAHYDRTASILNDQPIDQTDAVLKTPQAPQRLHNRKTSNSSCSAGEEAEAEQVQHVQLVIRKPPARQKRNKGEDKTNSLTQDYSFTSIMQSGGKTFDQDPTILKTSYAQSLEKCNFDCKELSTQDLSKPRAIPKRRFHSQANNSKKKNLVSSTPNLNAYDFNHQDEIEDDMFVSSAHNSMHQLPLSQTQKPLGILLPAGSRTSFGKEVSFCPVVSKFCWQEQSSEECNDGTEEHLQGDEESEDELLDNADATVIYNTKENENIASKYHEEFLKKEQENVYQENGDEVIKEKAVLKEINGKHKVENVMLTKEHNTERESENERAEELNGNETQQEQVEKETSKIILVDDENETITQNNETEEQEELLKAAIQSSSELLPVAVTTVSLTTNVNNETLKTQTDRDNNEQNKRVNNITTSLNTNTPNVKPTVVVARPLSIQLPILSEPPINRAHHILYASQQMLDNFQRQQQNEEYEHCKSQSTQNLSRMSGKTGDLQPQQCAATNSKLNNNNEVMKSKFKHEEKHPNSKGFLSRFANGFRFSLRRNKKKLQQKENQQLGEAEAQETKSNGLSNQNKSKSLPPSHKQADFIHIPLKGPLPENRNGNSNKQTNGNTANNGNVKNTTMLAKQKGAKTKDTNDKQQKVTGKPPIPPQQQQQLQQMLKLQSAQSSPQQQQPLVEVGLSRFYTEAESNQPATAHHPGSVTQDFLTSERDLYNENHNQQQFTTATSSQSCANNQQLTNTENDDTEMTAVNTNNTATYEFSSPSRASVSQKTQMFNNLSRKTEQQQPKIGLIETNLDTHETIITGKTRSLINIGPNQQQQQRFAGNKRLHTTTNTHSNHHHHHQQFNRHHNLDGNEADDDDYDDNDDDEVVVRPDGTVVVIKNAGSSGASQAQQIASVRRPHKSMEFLLDKENQKDVMPPENELQKSHDHNPAALSEHQLRIQASLQRLNIPDWFRQYNQNQKSPDGAGATGAGTYKPGNFTRKRTQDSGRWVGLNSKTTSLSSLGSQRSDRSPLLLSPSAHSHHGGQSTQHAAHQQGQAATTTASGASGGAFSRWSTSHLNSSQTSPSVSQRGSFSRGGPINSSFMSVNSGHSVIRNSMRQPYMGWRSQEKLSQRTAHERLASSLLSQQQRTSPTTHTVPANTDKLQPVTPEIQSSIKEVTSAIVHYVNDQTNQQRSRSTSPNSRKCWLESSFVGTRPLDSPQTPIIENTPLISAAQAAAVTSSSSLRPSLLNNNNNNINNNNNNLQYANHNIVDGTTTLNLSSLTTGNDIQLTRMNGGLNNGTSSSSAGGVNLGVGESKRKPLFHLKQIQECLMPGNQMLNAPERSLSNASLEDVLASLLGLPTHQTGANASDAYARSSTGGVLVSESQTPAKQQQQIQYHMPQKQQPLQQLQLQQTQQLVQKENLLAISKEEQQRLRRRSEGDAATKQKQQQQQQQQEQQHQFEQKSQHYAANAKTYASDTITTVTHTNTTANGHAGGATAFLPPRRVSLGDSSESNNRTASASGELQIKCRNNKCDRTATPADAKKYYKSCHNCTYLYCSRECRRAHWEKHRKACLHSRVSNLCRQVLASCKDDSDSLRHLSLLARKGFLSQGRGVVRILFRSPESAEGFIKNGFQCMGEASYVRWPDLMPAEMGLELYSELLKLSTEYRPDSKMLVYVAVCVVSEAPGMGQAPVRWERQLVSRCAKLKLCKTVLAELEQQQQPLPLPVTVVAVPEPTTEVLILTFNPQLRSSTAQRELVLSNILDILSRRGVILRKHYPEIFQRLQTFTEGQTDKFNPVTLHPRDSHTGQNFVCIIMPVQSETEIIKLPSIADGGNRVTTIDVGSTAALAQLDDDELLTRTATLAS
ncbi:serine-rich adhesin for platelets [Calliphora vicina]|uniref:serine-rich adhesin for platelets n=1 Tax=Calliphora vicina TaxID=7373 RepID=UPI00325B32E4